MVKEKKGKKGASAHLVSLKVSEPPPDIIVEAPEPIEIVKDVRTINIFIESIENMKPLTPVSLLMVKSEFNGKLVNTSQENLITHGEILKTDISFSLEIDILNQKDLDIFISQPVTFTVYQTPGEVDNEIYTQLEQYEQLIPQESRISFDSVVSMYEAFTGEKLVDKTVSSPKKSEKGSKKKGMEKSSQKTKGSKDKKSSTSKGSKKDEKLAKGKKKDVTKKVEAAKPSTLVGMCTMDMLPLILGNESFLATLELKPITPQLDDLMITYKNVPKMIVTVSTDKPFHFEQKPTILNFTLESVYNIPETMSSNFDFKVCAWVPLTESYQDKFLFSKSVYKAEEVEYEMKCWPDTPVLGDNLNTTTYRIDRDISNIKHNLGKRTELLVNKENPRLVYNYLKRTVLFQNNIDVLRNYLTRYRTIFLEFFLGDSEVTEIAKRPGSTISLPSQEDETKSKRSKSDGTAIKKTKSSSDFLHLMALVDISPLVYPGVTKLRVACQLKTYHEKETIKATSIRDSHFVPKSMSKLEIVGEDQKKNQEQEKTEKKGKLEKGSKSLKSEGKGSKKKGKGGKEAKKSLKEKLPEPPLPEQVEEPSIKVFNEKGNPTIVIIEIEVSESLVEKTPLPQLLEDLRTIIPKRPTMPKTVINSKLAEDNYRNVIQDVINDLNEVYVEYIKDKGDCTCLDHADFLTYLRRKDVYQNYIMSLTKSISLLVNKKFECPDYLSLTACDKKYQDLIKDVFVYLVSEMNSVIYKQLCGPDVSKQTTLPITNNTRLYAMEATEMKEFALAEKYYMERLCMDNLNPDVWFDYAVFQLELDSPEIAFEYLNEALARKIDHFHSLLLYGMLLSDKEKPSEAETCFMTVLVQKARWVEAWGILFIFYQRNNNSGGMAFSEDIALKHLEEHTTDDYFLDRDDLIWTSSVCPNTLFFRTACALIKFRMFNWAEDALAHEIAKYPGIVNYLLAVICYYKESYDHAEDHLNEARLIEGWNIGVVGLTGHCYIWQDKFAEAKEQFYYVLQSFDKPDDLHMLYVNCARALYFLGEEQEARKLILQTYKQHSTPNTWITAGICYYNENDIISAEECFTEANICDNRLPQVWAYLTLINLKMDRESEAEVCYKEAMKNNLQDPNMYNLLQKELNNFKKRNSNKVTFL